jgi:hypothetical protein
LYQLEVSGELNRQADSFLGIDNRRRVPSLSGLQWQKQPEGNDVKF